MNIVFIGFASSGKSATAIELAQRLGMKFVDTDREIENSYEIKSGEKIAYRDIIRKEGYEFFLNLESQVLKNLENRTGCVIAPGGGAAQFEENQKILKKLGPVIYLKTEPEVIFQRMKAKGIPLFMRDDPTLENLIQIWNKRDVIYAGLADHVIDNSRMSISQTVEDVISYLHEKRLFCF